MMEIFLYFLKLGFIGFGGPLALISMMQQEVVHKRKWMPDDEFRQTFGLIKAMPGPVAFQMSVFLGYRRGKFWGALLAALGLLLPSFFMMVGLALFYQQFVEVPWIHAVMKGMQIGAFALIVWALKSLSQGFNKKPLFWFLLVAGVGLTFYTSIPEPAMILLFGAVAVMAFRSWRSVQSVELTLTMVCLKAGAFVFGTGLAIVPFLEKDFVARLGWLNHDQFMDALAFGQLTPGPVTITVAFIGYKVAGMTGALIATVGIFFPAFFHMVTWFPRLLSWLQRQTWISSFSLGVTAAVCSAIVVALTHLAQGWGQREYMGLALLMVLMATTKLPSWAIILISGAGGFLMSTF